jgi:hypothetical protein
MPIADMPRISPGTVAGPRGGGGPGGREEDRVRGHCERFNGLQRGLANGRKPPDAACGMSP